MNQDIYQDPAVDAPDTFRCPDCKSMTAPKKWRWHYCIPYQEPNGKVANRVDVSKKRWDPNLQCWVLHQDPVIPQIEVPKEKKDEYYAASCEIGEYKGPKTGANTNSWGGHYPRAGIPHYSHSTYKPWVPWEGVDRKKWPNAWMALFTAYHQNDWHRYGKWVSDDVWQARLRGEYRPEPQYVKHYGYYSECED
jgi:hypothetical protein